MMCCWSYLCSYVPIFFEFTAYDEIKYLSFGLGVNDERMAEQALTFYKVRTSFDLLILNLISIYLHMF